MLKNKIQYILIFFFCFQILLAQQPQKPNSVEILINSELNFRICTLYRSTSDDENTSNFLFINEKQERDLSLTRDGGQNLIGPQLRIIRVIRTQELLEASDGGGSFLPCQ
jgi:hypothetical protein